MAEIYRFALVGNPNVGKSSLFNALTGLHQHTGNWPGKTVATAEGTCSIDGTSIELIDLPGTYSLSAHSPEEEVAAEYIAFGRADAVIVVCDATALERNLYLALQVMEITDHVVVCVNLMDEAKKRGITMDLPRLSQMLGVRVVGTSARQKKTLPPLLRAAIAAAREKRRESVPVRYDEAIEAGLFSIEARLDELLPGGLPNHRWIAMQLLLGGDSAVRTLEKRLGRPLAEDPFLGEAIRLGRERIARTGRNAEAAAATAILRRAAEVAAEAVSAERQNGFSRDRKADRILTGKKFGIPIMLLLLLILFYLTVQGANYPSAFLSSALFGFGDILSRWLLAAGLPLWLHDALILGVYRVTAWVVSVMLPPMAIFFPLFTFLEDVGYLPRMAFNLDKPFEHCRACGKQALTMAMGFGCNAAGVVGCRIIDSPRERLLAILTNSFVPCNGRFPILIFLLGAFFSSGDPLMSALLLTGVVCLGIAATFGATRLLSAAVLRGESSSYVLELPPYRKPQFGKILVRSLLDRTVFVLGRAAAVAAPAGLVLWLLGNFSVGSVSLLRYLSDAIDPVGRFLGMDGVILLAFILGFPANETVIPIAMMIYMAEGALNRTLSASAMSGILLANSWTGTTAACVIVFTLMHWPCSTTLLSIKKETGSWTWTALAAVLPTLCGALLCMLINLVFH